MGIWKDLIGTSFDYLRVGLAGFRLKNLSGNLIVRNAGDTADAQVTASQVNVSGENLIINSDAAGTGSDRTLTLTRNSVQAANLQWVFPGSKGTDGQALVVKAGTAAGVLEIDFAGISGSGGITVDTTSLAFGSASSVSMFTLPANAVIYLIEIIIDTQFNGTPTLSIGVSGNASKYVASTQVSLTEAATTVFSITPGIAPNASTEALQIAYTPGSASAGAARVLVYYGNPV